ncbi:anhydro-N-acetylmuramic acid kinase [Psychroflexus planctonicus]|uniref:Anhydro-N-acetylmuramic acid kinase n=1 Tax=Psychroflexus planctonicus TaxID=1526575 RepID=A0ABQ1SIH6_9FLAO|nr:anhydro-N-acetylmuramic acid kinase [Psychroflexus planctonicus]GGE37814.1 anhydro-N-acetylmuramic acid kinase [Psychroflexus planctonicus]
MNSEKIYHAIGVMSGTSLDGIDFCYVGFSKNTIWKFKIIQAETISYSVNWKQKLQNAHLLGAEELANLNEAYTFFLSEAISSFISRKSITNLDFVASHGHTVLHQPENGITLQIGNLAKITSKLKVPVVCDFRIQDVQLGGQGAPLVPIGDELLFNEFDMCLNLGGFANISLQQDQKRIAYDVCPVNIVLNYFTEKLGLAFDENGAIAKANQPDEALLQELNKLEFYQKSSPKSLGKEWIEAVFLPVVEKHRLSTEVIISTLTHHAAFQIAKILQKDKKVLITGGGAFNLYLIGLIKEKSEAEIVLPHNKIINYKEALIFAFLGVLRMRNETNVLASVTGASKNHSSGKIFPAS